MVSVKSRFPQHCSNKYDGIEASCSGNINDNYYDIQWGGNIQ